MNSYGYEGSHRSISPSNVEWARDLFNSLADGGRWQIPATGLIYQRRGDRLVLIQRLEQNATGISGQRLTTRQNEQHQETIRHFAVAGIFVGDETIPELLRQVKVLTERK